ncbi:MAG TPA: hypothetical protein VNI57_03960, partial [Candidatus Saccharimonadales bacterium]|nr:hypothetical protein [Candidatus Saccharimonadales bacterium]
TLVSTLLTAAPSSPGLRIVVTQLPPGAGDGLTPRAGGMLAADWGDGARIVLVAPGAAPVDLTADFHSAADPEISFDGKKMLFAAQPRAGDPWDIFEMDLADHAARRITGDLGDCRRPVYLGSFYTIDSPEPWYQVAFVSTGAGELDEQGGDPSGSLYTVHLDGTEVHRITFNPSSELAPSILPDGRLIFSSWQRSTLEYGLKGRISLFAAQTDGLDYAIFSGDEGPRIKYMPAVTTDRKVVFVEGDGLPWDGAGRLGLVTLRRNLHSHARIETRLGGLFVSPSALPGGKILVSRRPADGTGTHAVYRLDPETGAAELIFDDPERHDIQARLVSARPMPDGRSSVVSEKFDTGQFYALDVYESDLGDRWVAPGTPLRLRVLEGIPLRAGAEPQPHEGSPPLLQRRFLGDVPVEADGSFNVKLPVGLPVQLQLVDSHGLALRSCGWIWLRNRETRGCIGCHESGEMTPENRFVEAVANPAVDLTLPPEKRRTVDFRRDVAPIVEKKCSVSSCHGGNGGRPVLEGGADRAYAGLMTPPAAKNSDENPWGLYVHPGEARTSPLVWSLLGSKVSRPWDVEAAAKAPPSMPPAGSEPLTEDEKQAFIEWIDLGALWDGIPKAPPGGSGRQAPSPENAGGTP